MAFRDEQIQKRLFENLAIRHELNQRDRVYFYDFYESIAAYKSKLVQYDFSIVEYPIHWIIKYVIALYLDCTIHKNEEGKMTSCINFDVNRYVYKFIESSVSNIIICYLMHYQRILFCYWL